jgi:hypothetical protein
MPGTARSDEHHDHEALVYVRLEAHALDKGLSQVYHRDARCD